MSAVSLEPAVAAELEASAVAHRYAAGRGLEPVSFSVAAPGAVAVTGANGAGKSTLLRLVAGLLRPTGGAVRLTIGGRELKPSERRFGVGYAGPDVAFYDELTVEENLAFAAAARGAPRARHAVAESLEAVGLASRGRDRAAALSSGMVQRLRLAFALLLRPPVLLLDEPGSHMDDEGRATVGHIVDRQRRAGLVVIATNDEREWRLADHRIELRGRGLGHPA